MATSGLHKRHLVAESQDAILVGCVVLQLAPGSL